MPENQPCPTCGAPIPADAPLGHCPNCLLGLGFGPPPGASTGLETTRFGDYELIKPIGRGGMGVVYRARQISLKREVALKMLSPQSSAFPSVVERIRLEAEAAASLHHPHIVTIHDVGEHEGRPYFSMELIEGPGLDRFITAEGFTLAISNGPEKRHGPQAAAARLLAKIARAVDYAHKHGVLHRDLKPANVLIDAAGEPHLTDFGLAKVLGRERTSGTDSGMVMGTPAFMAPEQASGETKRVSTAADIYSLGAILYAMLTGHPPFHAATPLETLRQVAEEEPKHPSSFNAAVDRDLATICLKCLEKEPRRRYGTAEALAEDLERWLRREPIEARPVRAVGRLWRWCRREPTLAGMAAGLFLLLASSAVLGLTLYKGEKRRLGESEQIRLRQLSALQNRIEREWNTEGSTGVRITAEELALKGKRVLTTDGSEVVVALGVSTARRDSKPVRVFERYAPLLNYLQTNLATRPGPQVLLELHVYNDHANACEGLLKGEVQVLRCDPATYVLMRQMDTHITPLVQQTDRGRPELHGVIFTRTNTGIDRLEDLKDRSFTFGTPDSFITSYLPKAELVAAGLTALSFRLVTNVVNGLVPTAVRKGPVDAGAARWEDVAPLIKVGAPLRILREVRSPHVPWVAASKLDPAIGAAIRDHLLALRDIDLLAAVDPELTAFHSAHPSDYDALEQQVEQAKLFDQPPAQAPK